MQKIKILLVAAILFVGILIRLHNYDVYPQRGASSDEYTYSFLGVSLLTQHTPISWSFLPGYKNQTPLTIRNIYFPIVSPYFDHPPLNGLVVGAWSILNGQSTFQSIDLKTIRLVPIFLSMISSLLLFLLAKKLLNFKTAVWALLIYTTTTTFVMNGRVVFAENLLTPLLLLSLYFFVLWEKKMTMKKTVVLGILAGLSFWTKELGIATYFALLFLFVTSKIKWQQTALLTIVSLGIVALYAVYGSYYNAHIFWQIIQVQGDRLVGPETFWFLLFHPIIVNKEYFDGWYFLGFLSLFFMLLDYKKYRYFIVPSFLYFLLLLFSLTKEGEMGWYLIPLFPFMAIATAGTLQTGLEKKNWGTLLLLLFVGFYEMQNIFQVNFGLSPMQFRIFLFFMFGPVFAFFTFAPEKWQRRLGEAWFYLFILGNALITYWYIHPA